MLCVFPLLGVQCYYHFSYSLSFYLRTWWTLCWQPTSLYLGLLHYRMFLSLHLLFSQYNLFLDIFSIITHILSSTVCSATLLPSIKRFLPNHWNEDLIVWRFPYFRCKWHRLIFLNCCWYIENCDISSYLLGEQIVSSLKKFSEIIKWRGN